MRAALAVAVLSSLTAVPIAGFQVQPALPHEDAVRIAEFYRLADKIQDTLWPQWSHTPAPLLLLTDKTEFLTHHPAPPKDFTKLGDDVYARPRTYPPRLLATFPAFGPPAVIVVGEPQNSEAKTSTPWLIVVMHEHFHQLQYGKPGYYEALKRLDLSHGDQSGMWILNYPFPYDQPEVAQGFAHLRDLLLAALAEKDESKFRKLATAYVTERKKVFGQLSDDDRKYFSFQLWQEGIARYTQIKCADAAAAYQPSREFAQLDDYEPFSAYAARARQDTLEELRHADMTKMHRVFVYSFGAAEGLLLDRLHPKWKSDYFQHPLSTDAWFDVR